MSQFPQAAAFQVLEFLVQMSPKQREIAKRFYLWMLSIKKKKMNGLWMRVIYIAKQSNCCYDTVIRFLKEFKELVKTIRRRGKTNSYAPSKDFFAAMEFLDKNKMLNADHRKLKTWMASLLRAELELSYENVEICDPSCSDLRPNPSFIPFIKVPSTEICSNKMLSGIPLTDWQARNLSKFSEKALYEAVNDFKWYGQRREILNPYGLLLSRARAHV